MNLFTLAVRNVTRNRQRAMVTTIAMGFACAMMIVFSGLMVGMLKGSEYNIVSVNTGDIQIHQPGYRQDPDIYNLIEDADRLLAQFRQAGFAATGRIYTAGLMASDESSSGVQLRGIDLQYETTVSVIAQHVLQGKWLAATDPHGVVIGKKLARLLDVELDDTLVFVGQTADGFMANDEFHVRGILKSVSAVIDNGGVLMSDTMLRELIALPEGAHQIVVMRTGLEQDLQQVQQQVKAIAGPDLEVMSWRDLMPIIARFLDTAHIQTLIMQLFTYIAVGSVVLNAILMSVFERIHQFGIMKAIGVRPWQLVRLIYLESFVQAVIAAMLGSLLGGGLILYLQDHGIDMSALAGSFSFAGIALDPIWYADVSWPVMVIPVCFLFLMTLVAVIYPAAKAARLQPVEAIYHQ
jgi:ABC-type lipoprotein release transport system permease subunit